MRAFASRLPAIVAFAVLAACGKSPSEPTPPPPPPPVAAPVIVAITVPQTRVEVGQDVSVSAAVTDASPGGLTYLWSATAGTITGTGATATWRLEPGVIDSGADVIVSLTVVKSYQVLEGGQLVTREHRVTQQASPFRAHDSAAEIARISLTFLIDYFGDSTLGPDACLVDFSVNCAGRQDEYDDIVENRDERLIQSVEARVDEIEFDADRTFAWVTAPCTFRDVRLSDGQPFVAVGDCLLTAIYEKNRWWLCSSNFLPDHELSGPANRSRRASGSNGLRYWR